MIAGLSKAVTLYLTPVLALTAVVLSVLAFLAPTLVLQDRVALLTVTPSFDNDSGEQLDGPSLFLGLLGSCSRPKNDEAINCTSTSFMPVYDFSDLPSEAPRILLSSPSGCSGAIAAGMLLSVIFFFTFTFVAFGHKMGDKMAAMVDRPLIQRTVAWLGFVGFLTGITSLLIVRMWYGKGVDDFNKSIQMIITNPPRVHADLGNGFTMMWVAYAFYGVPVIVALSKLHVKAAK
ncbi:hypothetical protein CYLTODRAFT_389979 [Cylindrobasidium torrendii FP15055 ss-10]|uniref:Transmembrane protein n=1 Tax=Cylindrobasidium torrendii FP15055 ss-10 TaxID=1314674 RepID=A0A0D7BM90_9AGAR|nr:hypothetical protein CYLTODRAFT_389979 [Cylindrobasidium torrendii FP15055 ss-10]